MFIRCACSIQVSIVAAVSFPTLMLCDPMLVTGGWMLAAVVCLYVILFFSFCSAIFPYFFLLRAFECQGSVVAFGFDNFCCCRCTIFPDMTQISTFRTYFIFFVFRTFVGSMRVERVALHACCYGYEFFLFYIVLRNAHAEA